jgi:tRNA pseudouridine38-40 synthase
MRTLRLTLQYDGTAFAGWQAQDGSRFRTIQQTVENSLHKILKEKVRIIGSGRTDAGVHALGQIAHFQTANPMDSARLKNALSAVLPRDIAVTDLEEAASDFHARFKATAKIYQYLILSASERSAFPCPWAAVVGYRLNVALMAREAKALVGRHDLKSFQGRDRVERGSVVCVRRVAVHRLGDMILPHWKGQRFILFEIEANGFGRSMVRNIVGTLMDIGRGRLPPGSMAKIIRARDRAAAGVCASARGLTLAKVFYE